MSCFPASTKRWLATPLALALALGYSAAQAQVVPTPAPAQQPAPKNVVYYVDGKLATASALEQINPSDIDHLDVRKEAAQLKSLGLSNPLSDGAVLITTKANASSPDVVAFNNRFPLTPATAAQTAAVAAATAYITKNYPSAKLEEVAAVSGQADRYRAIFTAGGQRLQLLFDSQGQPVRQ